MKKGKIIMVFVLVIFICSNTALFAQTTIRSSYYVNAVTGDDSNNGRSEERPFKTMNKALEAVKMGVVKTITIIGEIQGFEVEDIGTDEILITGKNDSTNREKSKIIGAVRVSRSTVQFTHITIEAGNRTYGIQLSGGKVLLGQDTLIQDCYTGIGISSSSHGSLFLTANVIITKCDRAISLPGSFGSSRVANDSVKISENVEIFDNNIGIYSESIWEDYSVIISGNVKINNNRGAGIQMQSGDRLSGSIEISENVEVCNNQGGGIIAASVEINGGKIANNVTKGNGGGVLCEYIQMNGGEISNNQALHGGGIYIISNPRLRVSMPPRNGLIMRNGSIIHNNAEYGAGIFLESRPNASVRGNPIQGGTINLSGGTITGNEAEFVGGGIYVQSGAIYNAEGGTVIGNTAGDGGNNVFMQ